ncbi:Metallo-dependent phosphatase-like protein [Talaromyces proteolyticus]|uniref:Purple acid phosphatase n=1 Tax=Talaromyces proteolyticus TaxID=1131652 RepID=A0AAD4KI80_9EURO|nr:Metallo-dependent phosphatase-like protein [Talaromyces proteolyticus]KAH8691669.1 Metallo-dependent phosphatase-like protein [Talaromyces proteolyticus]
MQMRLAYAGDQGMMVSWNTFSKLDTPSVRYGRHPNKLDKSAHSDISVTYPTSTTYNNHVKITGLKPDTLYYYQPFGSNATTPYTFKTSRPIGDETPYSVAVVVDMGLMGKDGLSTSVGKGAANPLGPGDKNTQQSLQAQGADTDFLWHPGDIAYADYWLKEEIQGYLPNTTIADGYEVYESLLNQYYDELVPITSKKPYMVGPGNHEANCDNGGTTDKAHNISYTVSICAPGQTNFTGFRNHFRMPSAESGGVENFWYSFDNGMVHYIQFDTETDLGHGLTGPDEVGGSEDEDSGPFSQIKDAQLKWLEGDLASVDRRKTPWVVVGGHRPWYISGQNESSTVCLDCQSVFEPYFIKYDVDLVLSGHVHLYERNVPIANYVADPNGLNNPKAPWYITNGAAGHYDGLDSLVYPLQPYSAVAFDDAYGWSRLTFHNKTHLTHEFVASRNGSVLDSATLYKERKH